MFSASPSFSECHPSLLKWLGRNRPRFSPSRAPQSWIFGTLLPNRVRGFSAPSALPTGTFVFQFDNMMCLDNVLGFINPEAQMPNTVGTSLGGESSELGPRLGSHCREENQILGRGEV